MSKTPKSPTSRARPKTTGHPGWEPALELLRRGHFLEPALRANGINPESVTALMKDDPSVREIVDAARAEGEVALRARLDASDDWKREAWLLERFAQKRYHLPTKVTGVAPEDGGAPITHATERMTEAEVDAALDAAIAEAARRRAAK